MPQYKVTRQENGKYKIEQVPIFGLGMIRDFPYNGEWAARLVERMQELKRNDYYAPLIFGHNSMWSETEEKPAEGFLDNIRAELGVEPSEAQPPKDIYVGTIYADLIDIGEEPMKEIADLKYPYRSIEVRNETAEITALALLGGTEPHWKFPRLKVEGFKANPEADGGKAVLVFKAVLDANGKTEWIPSCAGMTAEPGSGDITQGKKTFKQRVTAWLERLLAEEDDDFDEYKEHNAALPKPGSKNEPAGEQEDKTGMGGNMPKTLTKEEREQFKQEYGAYPEEIKSLQEKAEQADTFRAQAAKAESDKFAADLQTARVSPAAMTLIGDLCGYAAGDKLGELRGKVKELVQLARDNKLIVPDDDTTRKPEGSGVVDFSDDKAVDAAVRAEMKNDPKLSYGAALEIVKTKNAGVAGKAGE